MLIVILFAYIFSCKLNNLNNKFIIQNCVCTTLNLEIFVKLKYQTLQGSK